MTAMLFRKTLLALSVAAIALPASAQVVSLGNEGFSSRFNTYEDGLQITGAYTGKDDDAISIWDSPIAKDLVLDATIRVTGDYAGGAILFQRDTWGSSLVGGNLINKGDISVTAPASTAIALNSGFIEGDVVNLGTLSASGDRYTTWYDDVIHTRTLDVASTLAGNIVNASSGKIIATGNGATAINLEAARLGYIKSSLPGSDFANLDPAVGKVINDGLIQATGTDSVGINATHANGWPYNPSTILKSIENHGTILAEGDGAQAIRIDGVAFLQQTDHLVNTGLIQSSDTAIKVYGNNSPAWYNPWGFNIAPVIVNSGRIVAGKNAIDAQRGPGLTVLLMEDGSKITGNLLGLYGIQVTGNAEFTGTGSDQPNIQAFRLQVGNVTQDAPARLDLLGAHTRIEGNLEVAGNSSLGLNLYSTSRTDTPVLSVSGSAFFESGAKVILAAQGKDFDVKGSTYTLLQADDLVTETGIDLSSSSALLKIDSYQLTDNRLVATVTGKSNDEISLLIGKNGGSLNSQRTAGALANDGVIRRIREQNPNDPLLQTLLNTSEAELTRIAEQLAPETNGGATQAATTSQNLVSNVTGSRTSSLRGASSGEGFKETGVWVQSLYSDATQDLRDGVAGYNAYSRGIAVGADGKLSDNLTLGLAYSFINTDVNGKSGNKTEVDSHAFTLYGGYELDNWFVDGSLTYGVNDNDSKRQIATTQAKADYDSDLLGLNLVGGYTWKINPQVLVEPRLAARYSLVNIDGYREKGSSAALKVEDQRYEAIELGAGVRVAGSFNLGAGTLEPQVKLMAYHDFAADQASSTSTFLLGNTPFVTTGAKAVRNSYEAGIGTDYKLGAVTLGVNYDYIGKSGFDADVFSAKVRYDF